MNSYHKKKSLYAHKIVKFNKLQTILYTFYAHGNISNKYIHFKLYTVFSDIEVQIFFKCLEKIFSTVTVKRVFKCECFSYIKI